MKVKIKKILADVKLPHRAHYNDAGADVYSPANFTINPGKVVKIDLGWSIEIPDTYMGLLMPRSGLASKGIVTYYTPIDSGYRGPVTAMLYNSTNEPFTIAAGERICQLVITPVLIADFVEDFGQERGVGGFASTGK